VVNPPFAPGERSRGWTIQAGTLPFGSLPLLMGIVNVTPDSFSDGGQYLDPNAAVEHGLQLAAEGADILDIGGESTRPGAAPVDAQEELRRVLPVLRELRRQSPVPLSIDTSKAIVAREAIAAGARILNDITALSDPEMVRVAAESGVGVCIMHMQGSPRTMQTNPTYHDVVGEVAAFLRRRRDELIAAGISQDRIAVDPGIGFGKTAGHNLDLLRNAWRLHALGCPVLIGPSRKRFILAVQSESESSPATRHPPSATDHPAPATSLTAGTIGVALALARQGVQVLRVHDVGAVRQALVLFQSVGGIEGVQRV
jgi:dihydropteroate synthase